MQRSSVCECESVVAETFAGAVDGVGLGQAEPFGAQPVPQVEPGPVRGAADFVVAVKKWVRESR